MSKLLQDEEMKSLKSWLSKEKRHLIDGEWLESRSGKTLPVIDPATEELIASVADGQKEDIELAVAAARRAFDLGEWRLMAPARRAQILWRISELVEKNGPLLAALETLENGKPYRAAIAYEIPATVEMFRYYAGFATKIEGTTIPLAVGNLLSDRWHAYTVREAVGVAGLIVPWNYPLSLSAWKLAPALSCGCSVVLKPAEETPLTALFLGELLCEAGVPKGVVNIVTGYGESAGAALVEHDDVDKIAFTGSTEVGSLIAKAASKDLKRVSLELGGKSPLFLFSDCNLEAAIATAASAIYSNAGQNCAAASRLYIERPIYEKVIEGISDIARKLKMGHGMDRETEIGPLISKRQLERILRYVENGKGEGAEVVCGGKRSGNKGYFVEPTLLAKARHGMEIVEEELFGPILSAMPFDNFDEAVALANDNRYGLAAGVWTNDLSKAHRLARAIRSGTVWINCYNIFNAALPFGGCKRSGWGREMGKEAIDLYTELKTICVHL